MYGLLNRDQWVHRRHHPNTPTTYSSRVQRSPNPYRTPCFTEKTDLPHVEDGSLICTDCESGTVYVCAGNTITSLSDGREVNTKVVEAVGPEDAETVSVTYLPEYQGLCIATRAGDILLYNAVTEEAENMGCVTGGILAMQWSPDHEVVAMISGEENLIIMTREFDPISEKSIHAGEFGEKAPVTAGWGSKATQFHGSEGKQAAKLTVKPPDPAFEWDDRRPRISWRGDGQYFATSCIDKDGGYRKLRIWNREGCLQYTGEDTNGLEQGLGWKPSGSLIASSQRLPNKHQIVFFEKNGLRHGDFTLPFGPKEFQVKEVSWSNDSSILAVVISALVRDSEAPRADTVLLCTVSNYHWYLKQTLRFDPSTVGTVVSSHWDEEEAFRFHVICSGGAYLRYTWRWCINSGTSNPAESCAVVSVIDGESVLSTPFKIMVVPPPMCAYKLLCYTQVNHLTFLHDSNDCAIILEDGNIVFVSFDPGRFPNTSEDVAKTCKIEVQGAGSNGFKVRTAVPGVFGPYGVNWETENMIPSCPLALYHWTWASDDCLLCIGNLDGRSALTRVDVKNEEGIKLYGKVLTYLESTVRTLSVGDDKTTACVQFDDGSCAKVLWQNGDVEPWLGSSGVQLRFPTPCNTVTICRVQGKMRLLALSGRFQLFCDDFKVCEDCTSFVLHGKFLLLTTHRHSLRCLLLDFDLPQVLEGKDLNAAEDAPRQLERGSLLVTSVVTDGRVVLQMPRGNLETIYPRSLMLDAICDHLDRFEYGEAFQLMKVHRINLNFLCDHDPEAFLRNLKEFVLQVGEAGNINLFLTELTNEDVCTTMYSAAYRSRSRRPYAFPGQKKDVVCEAVRKVLEELDSDGYLLSILTCHAKKVEPELDLALLKIKSVKDAGGSKKVDADAALRYLMYLVDTTDLFNVALGTYNFDLVLMVAEKSQKDPKEYVPFLNELNNLDTHYRHYKIDMHLGRYERALTNIALCAPHHFDECISLIKTQRLYTKALHLFVEGSEEYRAVWEVYGDYLLQKKHYAESGIVFRRSGNLEKALTSFELALNWSLVLATACQLKYSEEKLQVLARRIASALIINRRHREAALIYEEFLKDEEEVVRILLEAHLWDEALSRICRYDKVAQLEGIWNSAVKAEYENLIEVVDSLSETWHRHRTRLAVVRELKMTCDQDPDDDVDDGAYSDVASLSSRTGTERSSRSRAAVPGSIITMRTSRNRKKQERKKYTLKEGSRYEDLALITALAEVVSSADKVQEECGPLLKALVVAGFDSEARLLQQKFSTLLSGIVKHIPEIWPPERAEGSLPLGPQSSSSTIAEAIQKRQFPEHVISDPSLRKPPSVRMGISWKLNMLE